ncbi:MAG: PEP-CTERM sorting domain-containing protein [Planctomycetota bacterium]
MKFETKRLLAIAMMTGVGASAHAQIFSDNVGDPTKWTIAGDGDGATQEFVRYGIDYSNFDMFGNGFLTTQVPEAPNSAGGDAATTGILISANNIPGGTASLFAGVFANGVNVGDGTATEDFVLKYDSYMSVNTGQDGGGPSGSTNYQWAGINFTPADVPASDGATGPYNGPFASFSGSTPTSGQALAITTDQDGFDDYEVTISGRTLEEWQEGINNGLAGSYINDAWEAAGFTPGDPLPSALENVTGSDSYYSPIPATPEIFDEADLPGTTRQFYREQFPVITGSVDYSVPSVTGLNDNDTALPGGTPYNRWATHEIYYVDGVWTQVIDGVVVLQQDVSAPIVITEDDPETAEDESDIVTPTNSGTIGLGFLDGFPSFIGVPGANFNVYDNIVLEEVSDPTVVPDIVEFLETEGYLPLAVIEGIVGDYDDSGSVEQGDLNLVLNNWGQDAPFEPNGDPFASLAVDQEELNRVLNNWGNTSNPPSFEGFTVPEPSALAMLGGLALAGLRRRSA